MIAGYARVSSKEQADNSHALEQQIERLKAFGVEQVYVDVESGRKDNRADFLRLLGDLSLISQVVVTRLDRLSRSLPTLRKAIDQFSRSGVTLVALDDNLDTNTASGKFHINILGALAEMEVDRLSERVKHGHQHHRDRNAAWFPIFGYRKVGDRLELDDAPFLCLLTGETLSKAAIARELIAIFQEKRSLRKTLQAFNERYGIQRYNTPGRKGRGGLGFGVPGLVAWLNNPILRGHIAYNRYRNQHNDHAWDIRYNTHPDHRLLSDEEYNQIADLLQWNSEHGASFRAKTIHPVSGLVRCGECGSGCGCQTSKWRQGVTYWYQCLNYRERGCRQKQMLRESDIEAAVIDALLERSEAIANLAAVADAPSEPPELQALRAELRYYQAAPGHRAAAIVAELQAQITALTQHGVQTTKDQEQNRDLLLACFSDRRTWARIMTLAERRDVYRALVERVTIRDGRVVGVSLKV